MSCYAGDYEFQRCALNMDQIKAQRPPENPAKTTDSRFASYRRKFGTSSWELDALTPSYLTELCEQKIRAHIRARNWEARTEQIEGIRARISEIANDFEDKA